MRWTLKVNEEKNGLQTWKEERNTYNAYWDLLHKSITVNERNKDCTQTKKMNATKEKRTEIKIIRKD